MVLCSTFLCGFCVFHDISMWVSVVASCNFGCFSSCLCCILTICEFTLYF